MVLKGVNQSGRLPIGSSTEVNIIRLCRRIWDESQILQSVGFPPDMRDLFIEQGNYNKCSETQCLMHRPVFMCGFNGFAEFLQPKWAALMIAWQQPHYGCFVYATFSNATDPMFWQNRPRFRRSVRHLPNNCSDHMSGLAFATLILFLKNV